ncbi:MAG TPA: relaxase/mobilization nuclease domain-containing protein [Rhizomicrobium sp.]|nr:relaxase/mobilization nuclease domain-containing protein [Rhizomicrobium sp.]
MIIKGGARGGGLDLAKHLNRTDTNERAVLVETRGVVAQSLTDSLLEMEAVAMGAATKRPFYHASINTPAGEPLTREQQMHAIERLEKEMGLEGQARIIVEHQKKDSANNDRTHVHIVWSRIDLETMKTRSDSFNYVKHELVARDLEREFGHARVQGAHIERDGKERPTRTPSHAEMQQAERTGLSPHQATKQITEIWQRTDSGQAFAAAIENEGWRLAQGDRRDFVAVDPYGEAHSLSRRIEGAKAADVRARMKDVDRESLPTVALAKAAQQVLAHERLFEDPTSRRDPAGDLKGREDPARDLDVPSPTRAAAGVVHADDRAVGGIAKGVGKALDAVVGVFESLLAPPTPEEQRAAAKNAARETAGRSQARAAKDEKTREAITDSDKQKRIEEQLLADLERARTRERTRER